MALVIALLLLTAVSWLNHCILSCRGWSPLIAHLEVLPHSLSQIEQNSGALINFVTSVQFLKSLAQIIRVTSSIASCIYSLCIDCIFPPAAFLISARICLATHECIPTCILNSSTEAEAFASGLNCTYNSNVAKWLSTCFCNWLILLRSMQRCSVVARTTPTGLTRLRLK